MARQRSVERVAPSTSRESETAMYLTNTITSFLGKREVSYELVAHRHSITSGETANTAHVARRMLAKGVLFCDDQSYTLAVVPASSRVDPNALAALLNQQNLMLASEDELALMFPDCEVGAVPAIGAPYSVPSVVDVALLTEADVYLEAGDHRNLLHISGDDFRRLMHGVARGVISHRTPSLKEVRSAAPYPYR
jgi:Ala-tRNA(Pro) deacylase